MSPERFEFEWAHDEAGDHAAGVALSCVTRAVTHAPSRTHGTGRYIVYASAAWMILAFFVYGPELWAFVIAALGATLGVRLMSRPRVRVDIPHAGHVVEPTAEDRRFLRALGGSTEKQLGTHRLTLEGGLLSWEWIEGRLLSRHPAERVEALVRVEDRLVFIVGGGVSGTLPLAVFESDEARRAFEAAIVREREAFEAQQRPPEAEHADPE